LFTHPPVQLDEPITRGSAGVDRNASVVALGEDAVRDWADDPNPARPSGQHCRHFLCRVQSHIALDDPALGHGRGETQHLDRGWIGAIVKDSDRSQRFVAQDVRFRREA
jgi:hypothetical protein